VQALRPRVDGHEFFITLAKEAKGQKTGAMKT